MVLNSSPTCPDAALNCEGCGRGLSHAMFAQDLDEPLCPICYTNEVRESSAKTLGLPRQPLTHHNPCLDETVVAVRIAG